MREQTAKKVHTDGRLVGLLGLLLLRLLLLAQLHDSADDPQDNVGAEESYITNTQNQIPHSSMIAMPAQSQEPNFDANL